VIEILCKCRFRTRFHRGFSRAYTKFWPLSNGQAKDITEAVLFLADDERSAWITGAVLPVDGGVAAGRN
jgi:NAD(P)-dependent dehydrogenase (short-subunit alcohol dehydrogenase family)